MTRAVKTDPTLDAMIEAEVREALRPYEDARVYPPEVLEELRHMLRIVMRTHPTAAHLLEQLRPRAAPDESGKEDVRVFSGALARSKKAEGE
jgi:hypothetical protein